jgi:hypothetical protein
MNLQISLPCSQELANGPEIVVSRQPHALFKTHFNIITFQSMPMSPM